MRVAWKIAFAALLLAAGVLVCRQWPGGAPAPAAAPGDRVDYALDLLAEDPAAWRDDTRSAVRIAAAAAEEHGLDDPGALYVTAVQLQREGSPSAAEALYRRAAMAEPDWSWPHASLGSLVARSADRLEEAAEELRRAIALEPDWARPHNSLAVVLRLQEKYPEAEEHALRALELDPDDIAAHNNYANLLVQLGRLAEAEEHYLAAHELDPENPKPAYNLACLYALGGMNEKALEWLPLATRRSDALRREALLDPDLAALRETPGFQEALGGFAPEAPPAPETGEKDAPAPEAAPETGEEDAPAPETETPEEAGG
ncbi:MAG: tetratricopeptide repeat protein [Candidatus Hydrogenedentes bacterium]|nr:tetratricopeptide repeat protein [Candidatus Hydrogenedentota bacterium]